MTTTEMSFGVAALVVLVVGMRVVVGPLITIVQKMVEQAELTREALLGLRQAIDRLNSRDIQQTEQMRRLVDNFAAHEVKVDSKLGAIYSSLSHQIAQLEQRVMKKLGE